ncbi:MAG: hypothetical protein LCH80_22950, partial [Proteobacteria bacterium]|nr:hypothetical protein [Pseudomonadota bacterium]
GESRLNAPFPALTEADTAVANTAPDVGKISWLGALVEPWRSCGGASRRARDEISQSEISPNLIKDLTDD